MAWSLSGSVITQSGTDTNLSGIANIAGVSVISTSGGVNVYTVGTSINRIDFNGDLTWDPDVELLVTSENTRISQSGTVQIGIEKTINGKAAYSRGTGLIMNRNQPNRNAANTNYHVLDNATFRTFGGQIKNRGTVFFGTNTSGAENRSVNVDIVGKTEFFNLKNEPEHGIRFFCQPELINVNCVLSGSSEPFTVFSTLGFNTLAAELDVGNYASDGNLPRPDVTVEDAIVASNKGPVDYSAITRLNGWESAINKYIFVNLDAGSNLKVSGAVEDLALAEVKKDLRFKIRDLNSKNVNGASVYIKLNGASLNPPAGTRFNGVDDYVTPKTHILLTGSNGLTNTDRVLYAVAQRYNSGQSPVLVTPESLTNGEDDTQTAFVWSYNHLLGQAPTPLRGTGVLTQNWTVFDDLNVTLSEVAVAALTELSTLDELYDTAKYWKTRPIAGRLEYPSISTQPVNGAGSMLDLGTHTLRLSNNYPDVFTAGSNEIRVKSSQIARGAKFNTIRAAQVWGDLDGVNVEGAWNVDAPISLEGVSVTTLIIRNAPTGEVSLTNCNVGVIENLSGQPVTLFLQGTSMPTLQETNGSIEVATPVTFNDAAGGEFTLIVSNPLTGEIIKPYDSQELGSYSINAGSASQLRVAAHKKGHYTLVRNFDIAGEATFNLVFTPVAFVDMSENIEDIESDLVSTTIINPYAGITALVRGVFQRPRDLTQNQFKRIACDLQGRESLMMLLLAANVSASSVFETTSTGIVIKQPAMQFAVAGNFEVNTLAFVDNQAVNWNGGVVPDFEWNPENDNNRKVIGTPVPVLLQSNLGVDGGSGSTGDIDTVALAQSLIQQGIAKEQSLNVINNGVKKASLLIPHSEDL